MTTKRHLACCTPTAAQVEEAFQQTSAAIENHEGVWVVSSDYDAAHRHRAFYDKQDAFEWYAEHQNWDWPYAPEFLSWGEMLRDSYELDEELDRRFPEMGTDEGVWVLTTASRISPTGEEHTCYPTKDQAKAAMHAAIEAGADSTTTSIDCYQWGETL